MVHVSQTSVRQIQDRIAEYLRLIEDLRVQNATRTLLRRRAKTVGREDELSGFLDLLPHAVENAAGRLYFADGNESGWYVGQSLLRGATALAQERGLDARMDDVRGAFHNQLDGVRRFVDEIAANALAGKPATRELVPLGNSVLSAYAVPILGERGNVEGTYVFVTREMNFDSICDTRGLLTGAVHAAKSMLVTASPSRHASDEAPYH